MPGKAARERDGAPSMPPHDAAALKLDPLTGLPDRRGFISEIRVLQNLGVTATVIALDIRQFTALNEEFGLDAGDELLRAVADRCARVGRRHNGHCVVGRVGADEFALALVPPSGDPGSLLAAKWVEDILSRLQQALALPFEIAGQRLSISTVIGQAWMSRSNDAAMALQHAVTACHFGSEENAVNAYEEKDGERRLTQLLREAVANDRFEVYLQPKVALADGRLVGFEALARWNLPDGTPVPPNVFIGLAERHNLISQLGDRILARALRIQAEWARGGLFEVPVAVNVSALQIHSGEIVLRVAEALAQQGVAPNRLELELTESKLLTNTESSLRTLHALRTIGVWLSIDDFGTGYSSLNYLRRIPVHRLKIDASFVSGIAHDPGAREIVHLLVQLAHKLGLSCVAEGIETRAQLDLLREMGCDEGQGFMLATPMASDQVARRLGGAPPWADLFAMPEPDEALALRAVAGGARSE